MATKEIESLARGLVAEFPTLDGAIDNGFDRHGVVTGEAICLAIQAMDAATVRAIRATAGPRPVAPGAIRLIKLAREGRLGKGDTVETARHGLCTVVAIVSAHCIHVEASNGQCYRYDGISFGADAHVERAQ